MANALGDVLAEQHAQYERWGEQNHPDLYWLGILMEEVGETSKEIIEHASRATIRGELVQVVAVALSWIECIDRQGDS